MKKYLLFLLFAFSFYFGQTKEFPLKNEDFSSILVNNEMYFEGIISKETPFKIKFTHVIKNPENPDTYLISGLSDVKGNKADFLGELTFKERYDVKNDPGQMLLFGDIFFIENGKDEHAGMFKGKVRIQTGKDLNKELIRKEGFSTISFKGKWKNYSNTLNFDVWWTNYEPDDMTKVIFK
jgi:hypothetical protein